MKYLATNRKFISCICGSNVFISDIDKKNLKLRFSLVDNGDGTRSMVHLELLVTPQGEAVCRNCGRKIDIEAEEVVVSV